MTKKKETFRMTRRRRKKETLRMTRRRRKKETEDDEKEEEEK